jgi:fluoride exporter
MTWLLVALGSALGGIARHATSLFVGPRYGEAFPWATLIVNVTGSFAIGICAALLVAQRSSHAQWLRELVMIGFLGGFTTFSAFSLQTLQMMRDGKMSFALLNILGHVVTCLIAVWLGYLLVARPLGISVGHSP